MGNGDESAMNGTDKQTADESGNKPQDTIESLKRERDELRAERDKALSIKEKIVEEQKSKNKKHAELKGSTESMEAQLAELREERLSFLSRFETMEKELSSTKAQREELELEQKAELASLVEKIPAEKKALLDDSIEGKNTREALKLLKKNAKFFLGDNSQVALFSIPKPERSEDKKVFLTATEKEIIKGVMPEDVALEKKRTDPKYFDRFKKN